MKSDVDCTSAKNLQEFVEIYKEKLGGGGFYHHPNLVKYASKCTSIKELGVNQGMSLALMTLTTNKTKVCGVDVNRNVGPYLPLFEKYAEENSIDFSFIQASSADRVTAQGEYEMLHIDSLHNPAHLQKELLLHAPKITKYIAFHDTADFKRSFGLFPVIAKYITEIDQNWVIVEHNNYRVGYTVIARRDKTLPPGESEVDADV